jgi:triosephosphate isomerase
VGHSERRAFAHETDREIAEKIRVVQKEGMKPILCIGENLAVRRKGVRAVETHLLASLKKDAHASAKNELIVAYEPLWAIGTGVHAAPSDAAAMSRLIKGAVKSMFGIRKTIVLYGGSVDSANIAAFSAERDIDGFLVGGASTRPKECEKMLSILSL